MLFVALLGDVGDLGVTKNQETADFTDDAGGTFRILPESSAASCLSGLS